MLDQVTAIAASVGLHYDFDTVVHTKTLLAHELLHFAKAQGRQLETAEVLFRAYFEQGRHVGRDRRPRRAGAEAGARPRTSRGPRSRRTTTSATCRPTWRRRSPTASAACPFFVIDGRYGVSGAQAPDVFAGRAARRSPRSRRSVR